MSGGWPCRRLRAAVEPVGHRPHLHLDALQRAKGPFHQRQALVRGDRRLRTDLVLGQAGADQVDAVEPCLGHDLGLATLERVSIAQRMIADMTPAGLAPSTKEVYLQGVRGLALSALARSAERGGGAPLSSASARSARCGARHLHAASRRHPLPVRAHARPRVVAVLKRKVPSAQAQASAQCPVGRRGSRHPWPRKASSPQSRSAAHVCVRSAHQ
jgi:hypothetical protein